MHGRPREGRGTMEIRVADVAGTCPGVERALRLVQKAAAEADGAPVWTLGPLIHNTRVVEELDAAGVRVAAEPEDATGATLVIRSHGVAPSVEERAREVADVIDATCPLVKRVHEAVRMFADQGRLVVIVGEKGHSEVEGARGYAPDALVVTTPEEVHEALADTIVESAGVVAQTTQTPKALWAVVAALHDHTRSVQVKNTICDATSKRQEAATRLAAEVDRMVVLGGRGSANTRRLAELCRASCPQTMHVESPDELDAAWFEGAEVVGVTAGASTPTAQIDELVASLTALLG